MNKMRALLGAGFIALAALLPNPVAAQNQSVIPQLTVSGQLQRWTGMTLGGKNVGTVAIVDASGNQITSFGGSGGTSSSFAATFPSTGTAIGMSQGGNMVSLTGTSNNLNVQCANCSGSGVSTADAATFTASSSLFAGTGGFFQTTATNNALTNGQQGMLQMTANRAAFTNLRNASGAELGVAAAPLQVSLANTAANATAVKVDGSAVTQPVSASALPLPSGAATSANQSTIITDLGTVTETAPGTDTASSGLNGRLQRIAQNLSTLNTTAGGAVAAGTNIIGKVGVDQTTPGTTNLVALTPAHTGAGATGAAPPVNAAYIGALSGSTAGGLTTGMIACDSTVIYDASTTGSTELVALSGSKTIYVCGYSIIAGGTVNVKLITGTGTACATGSSNKTPAYQLTAQAGISDGAPFFRGLKTASGGALCINASGAVAAQAIVYYAQF